VTRFAKRGLQHTSNSLSLEDHILAIKRHVKPMLALSADQISNQ